MQITDKLFKNKKLLYITLWTALFLFSILLFWIGINNECLSTSEGFTYAMTNNSLKDIIQICRYDYNPPLYYIMIKLFSMIFGNAITALRFFSLLGTLSLLSLSIGPVRKIFGRSGSIIYMLLIMVLPAFSYTSQNAEIFSWACFFVTASVLYGYLAATGNKVLDWIILGFLSIGSCYIHYYAMTAIVFLYIFIITYLLFTNKKKLILFSILSIIIIISFLPWISVLNYQIAYIIKRYWITKVNYFTTMNSLTYLFNGKSTGFINYAGLALFAVLLYYAVRLSILKKNKESMLLYLSLFTYSFTFLFLYLFSKHIKPVLHPPYIHSITGILLIIAVYTLTNLKNIKTSVVVVIFLILISLPASISIRTVRVNEPLNQAIIYLKLNMKKDDLLLHSDEQTASVLTYYFPNNRHFLFKYSFFKGYMNYKAFSKNLTVDNDVRSFLNKSNKVWIAARNENYIPFNYYKSVVYNDAYRLIDNPEIFEHRNSWITVELFKYEK